MTLLRGHGLLSEGRAFSNPPCCYLPFAAYRQGTGGEGHAKCSCGEISPHLPSGAERKRWHAAHKMEILRRSPP